MRAATPNESPCGGISTRHNGFVRCASVAANAGIFIFGLTLAAPAQDHPAAAPSSQVGIEQQLGHQVPLDLKFRDESGNTVRLGSYFGKKPVILSLVYYGCRMMCTLTEYGLVDALKELQFSVGDQFEIVTVSFNPKEGPEDAKAHKATYTGLYGRPGAKQGWHFLVGDEPSIHALCQSVGFEYKYMPDIDLYNHPTGIIILTPSGKVSRYFYGVQYPAEGLHLALVDAGREMIADPRDMDEMLHRGYTKGGDQAGAMPSPPSAPAKHWTSPAFDDSVRKQ